MTDRGRVRTWVLAAAGLGMLGVGFLGYKTLGRKTGTAPRAGVAASKVTEKSPLPELSAAIGRGDGLALAILKTRLEAKTEAPAPPPAMTEEEGLQWIEALISVRTGLSRFSAYGRASAVVVTSEILHKFDASPAPANWMGVLPPSAEVFSAALADETWQVRVAALSEIKGFWNWGPRRDFMPKELTALTVWKNAFPELVLRRLNDPETEARAAAVACLGTLPLNDKAEPALRHLDDPKPGVRLQVLISFADRPALLSEEAILPLLYDSDSYIPPIAERILKTRGLSAEQVGLGKLVVHPRPDMRISAIPFLKDRADIDPIVWLLYLSRDLEESVRLKALAALSGRDAPEARSRIVEMASNDASPRVRASAEKLLPDGDSTASVLPPLPATSSARLKLKAN